MRGPVAPDQPGCCRYTRGPRMQSAQHCPAEPTWAGVVTFAGYGSVPAFACAEHRQVLERAEVMQPGDRYSAELERRRAYRDQAWGGCARLDEGPG